MCFTLLFAYLGSAVLTDIIRHTEFEDYARGWSKLLILGGSTLWFLKVSRGRWALLRYFFAGLAAGFLVSYTAGTSKEVELWKFVLGPAVTILIGFWATFAVRSDSDSRFANIYTALGVFHFFQNSRSLGALTLSAALVLYLSNPRLRWIIAANKIAGLASLAICLAGC